MHAPGWSCPLEQVRPGSYVKAFALLQWTLTLLQGLGFVAQHMDMDPLRIDHGRVFTFFSRAAYAQLPKKHEHPLGILRMTQLPVTEEPHLAQQS